MDKILEVYFDGIEFFYFNVAGRRVGGFANLKDTHDSLDEYNRELCDEGY